MKWIEYLFDHLISILIWATGEILCIFMMYMFHVTTPLIFLIVSIFFAVGIAILLYDYLRKKTFYDKLNEQMKLLEEKYLIHEMLEEPSFLEGKLFMDALYQSNKSMNEHIHLYAENMEDFKEYIEMWVHEVKLPIAGIHLLMHNYPQLSDARLKQQILAIENYIEQALFYVRSENAEKDYLIKQQHLLELVRKVIRKNKDILLENHIAIEMEDADALVYTDGKWIEFVINQIVSNAIKYRKSKDAKLTFAIEQKDKKTILIIEDNGIGIPAKDLPKVFEKSFTGENGRKNKASTGMGLYLCQKLCKKLGHGIWAQSEIGIYTRIQIVFADDEYYKVLE